MKDKARTNRDQEVSIEDDICDEACKKKKMLINICQGSMNEISAIGNVTVLFN